MVLLASRILIIVLSLASTVAWATPAQPASPANAPQCTLLGPGVISTGLQETSATLSVDGKTLYFMRSDFAEADDTILVSHRVDGHWSTPRVAAFSGRWHDSAPMFSPDGKRLYFVSNRPLAKGSAPVTITYHGHQYPGSNFWYIEQQSDGGWSKPAHVDNVLAGGAMSYHPSITEDGDFYFSSHREGSGTLYQIYVARFTADGYAAPQRVKIGSTDHTRMDPSIDPEGRFLVYAGNEGDSEGSADLYIVFRQQDGTWGEPIHLPGEVNSRALENSPTLGHDPGILYVSSERRRDIDFPKPRDDYASLQEKLHSPLNGSRNIWRCDISTVLRAHAITAMD